mmetsp:Transcript_5046/g.12568  ORF Transcript_5046/g.12568 Transcript_5046/m.12568 type:complete len:95 (-) Transcript_5046:1314-1598(-)
MAAAATTAHNMNPIQAWWHEHILRQPLPQQQQQQQEASSSEDTKATRPASATHKEVIVPPPPPPPTKKKHPSMKFGATLTAIPPTPRTITPNMP